MSTEFLPILFYPGLALTNHTAEECLKAGGAPAMVDVMEALLKRFPALSTVITALDVTVDPEAFGCETAFSENAAPRTVSALLHTDDDPDTIVLPGPHAGRQDLHYEAVKEMKGRHPNTRVFGNVDGPFTLAAMLVPFSEAMTAVIRKPDFMDRLSAIATDHIIARARAYKEAGADGILLDEASAGVIPPKFCRKYSTAYIKKIVEAVQDESFAVMVHNCGNIKKMAADFFDTGCRILSVGNAVDIRYLAENKPSGISLCGNLDPMLLKDSDPETVRMRTAELLEKMADVPDFILSPGCDCPPESRLDNIDAMIGAMG